MPQCAQSHRKKGRGINMATEPEMVTKEEAMEQVRRVCVMLCRLHLAFAQTIVNELGEKEGKRLILKAIKELGVRGGERTKAEVRAQGKENTPENRPVRRMPDGDPYCELVVRPTTEQERKDFAAGEDWEYIDRPEK